MRRFEHYYYVNIEKQNLNEVRERAHAKYGKRGRKALEKKKIRGKFDAVTLQRYFAQSTKAKVGRLPLESGRVIEKYRHFGRFYPRRQGPGRAGYLRICMWILGGKGQIKKKYSCGKYRLETTIPSG